MNVKDKILHYQFFKELCNLPFIEAIYLYGSRARGDNKERSDIDLAILCPTASEEDWLKIIDIIENADTLLKIDYVRMDDLSNEVLKQNILEEKVILFER